MILTTRLFGATFQNPVLLAAGTCGFGRELFEVLDVDALGGFVTKSVTLEPRNGNQPLRVAEFGGGMLNSIGLANPGLEAVRKQKLPWIQEHVRRAQVLVSVAGHTAEEFLALVEGLEAEEGFLGFEINLSCPNDARRGGPPFALDPDAVAEIVSGCRERTDRPLLAKLAPHDPDLAGTVRVAEEAGADGLTLVNTLPGTLLRGDGEPEIGAGQGGVSGPALTPVGLLAVRTAREATSLPLVGVGGVSHAADAVAYARAGAGLVEVGTATFAAPRAALGVVKGLERYGRRKGLESWDDLVAGPPPAAGGAGEEEARWHA